MNVGEMRNKTLVGNLQVKFRLVDQDIDRGINLQYVRRSVGPDYTEVKRGRVQ